MCVEIDVTLIMDKNSAILFVNKGNGISDEIFADQSYFIFYHHFFTIPQKRYYCLTCSE